jgi:hypothetical protein
MHDQELIKKLQSLREIKPESSWKQETRDILLAQLSNSSAEKEIKISPFEVLAYNLKNYFAILPNTAWAIICLVVVLAGGASSALAIKNSQPGDPFYIAKVWQEKIQLAMTFDKADKAKLGMKLASLQAKAISEELSSPDFNAAANPKKAAQLAQNFQQEINTVKENYSVINKIQAANPAASVPRVAAAINNDDAKVGIGSIQKATDSKVYTVESGKDNKGIQVYTPAAKVKASSSISVSPAVASSAAPAAVLTSTASSSNINDTLDRAAQSFNTKDFSKTENILNQVGEIIDNMDSGAVKGATESGTSTAGAGSSAAVGSSSK